jgi:hypothetical protein
MIERILYNWIDKGKRIVGDEGNGEADSSSPIIVLVGTHQTRMLLIGDSAALAGEKQCRLLFPSCSCRKYPSSEEETPRKRERERDARRKNAPHHDRQEMFIPHYFSHHNTSYNTP